VPGSARSRLATGSATRLSREATLQLPARVDDDQPELDDQPPSVGIVADDLPASIMPRRRVINHFLEFDPEASGSVGR
jgi:hypothetical protein